MKRRFICQLAAKVLFTIILTIASVNVCQAGPYGPKQGVAKPAGAVDISPGMNIQDMVNAYPAGTTFYIKTGVHNLTYGVNPKSGNTFLGEYGAVLDGSNWSTSNPDAAAFWAINQDIDNVTIKNLKIYKMPKYGISAYFWMSDNWTIEDNEICNCLYGVGIPNNSTVRGNHIHHNIGDSSSLNMIERGGGYAAPMALNVLFESNDISYNGQEQKICISTNVRFINNFVHHNFASGIWFDGENMDFRIEGNICEDNGAEGIFDEISGRGVICNNIIRRSGTAGIFISTSRDVEVYGNVIEDCWRGIDLLVDFERLGPPVAYYNSFTTHDLINNNIHDNIIKLNSQAEAYASGFTYMNSTSSSQVDPYRNGSKNLKFTNNHYYVPVTSGQYWIWPSWKTWTEWRGFGHDLTGTIRPSSEYVPSGGSNVAPTISSVTASPSIVTGTSTSLSVAAADDVGEANLTYTWASSGPAPVSTSANGSNAAKNVVATFSQAGSYTFTVTARDAGGLTKTATVAVTVSQTLTTVSISPSSASVGTNGTKQFIATAWDQFGKPKSATFAWTVSGGGTISTTGLFTAGATAGGPFTVTASTGGKSVSASVTVTSTAAYTLVASPSSVVSGSLITVVWTAPAGGTDYYDTVEFYQVGAPNSALIPQTNTQGQLSGTFSVTAPSIAGSYEFRYFRNTGVQVATSNPVTVTNPIAGQVMHVSKIEMSLNPSPSGTRASARIFVVDANGVAVSGATVTGVWNGPVSGTSSGVTGTTGAVNLLSVKTKKSGTFTFTVTGITKSGSTYNPSLNLETSDSITK